MKRHIPNLLTLSNLLSGSIGVIFVFTTDLRMVSLMIAISLVFDFMDGAAARWLKVKSELGKELDSLADMVSFGLLPSLIAYKILADADVSPSFLMYTPLLMTLMSAIDWGNSILTNAKSLILSDCPPQQMLFFGQHFH